MFQFTLSRLTLTVVLMQQPVVDRTTSRRLEPRIPYKTITVDYPETSSPILKGTVVFVLSSSL
jgi:hypothetical protein